MAPPSQSSGYEAKAHLGGRPHKESGLLDGGVFEARKMRCAMFLILRHYCPRNLSEETPSYKWSQTSVSFDVEIENIIAQNSSEIFRRPQHSNLIRLETKFRPNETLLG